MISVDDNGEFTYTIFDLIVCLKKLEKFAIKIWVTGHELPFIYDHNCDFHFLQESIRISRKGRVTYVALDGIASISVIKDKDIKDVAL